MEKRGGWKTSPMTPLPKRGFGPPLVRYVFHPPQVSVLCFPVQKSTTEQTRSSSGGVQIFREGAFSGTFSSPCTFCTPPYHGPALQLTGELPEKLIIDVECDRRIHPPPFADVVTDPTSSYEEDRPIMDFI